MAEGNIIGDKYRGAYKGDPDWIGSLITDNCTIADDNGKNARLDLDKLFDLAAKNGIDCNPYFGQVDRPNAPGRLRMTLGNMLRARAKRRFGLLDLDGAELTPPESFQTNDVKTENLDGSPIVDEAKAEAEAKKKAEREAAAKEREQKKADREQAAEARKAEAAAKKAEREQAAEARKAEAAAKKAA